MENFKLINGKRCYFDKDGNQYSSTYKKLIRVNKRLESIVLPNSVTSIEKAAFRNSCIKSVKLPDIKVINEGTFSFCSQLTSINIPDGVEEIKLN